jgi:hypothetical protein
MTCHSNPSFDGMSHERTFAFFTAREKKELSEASRSAKEAAFSPPPPTPHSNKLGEPK